MSDIKELVENLKMNVNVMDYAAKHYGFEFIDTGANIVKASCKLKSHGHVDDTPSFMYYRDTNSFFCQGCKKGGSIIELVAIMEDLETKGQDFIEIIKMICANEGIECNLDTERKVSPEAALEMERRTNLAVSYMKNLWGNKEGRGFQYLLSRGFTEQTIKDFSLGLTAPNESKFGLANISDRISFPILNSTGKRVLAFSFRTLDETDQAKYINYSTDEIFHKGEIFYGWAHAIREMRAKKHVYVVEGYCDMISMYQVGLKNTIAMMTNQMTEQQIALLSKFVKNVTLVIDQDQAGINGFNNTIIMMLEYGLNVKVVTSLGYMGKDMNDVCNKLNWDLSKVEALITSNAVDGIMFKLGRALDKYDEKMLALVDRVLRISDTLISSVHDPVRQKVYRNYVNKRLGI